MSEQSTAQPNLTSCQPGGYIACIYDHKWYIGNIIQRNDDEQDVYISFMNPGRGNTFEWPPENRKDQCWVPFQHILYTVETPSVADNSGRRYKLMEMEHQKIKHFFKISVHNIFIIILGHL